MPESAYTALALTPDMLAFFEGVFGDYPFEAYGAIVDDDFGGIALETQTRSYFGQDAPEDVVAHELAHQWLGNHASVGQWSDIWLNEGWATYASRLWLEEQGTVSAQEMFEEVLGIPDEEFWDFVIADPGPADLFAAPVYYRGAATLHALRREVGDEAFFELTAAWVKRHGGGTATTANFQALAEEVSGQDLGDLLLVWLYTPGKPVGW